MLGRVPSYTNLCRKGPFLSERGSAVREVVAEVGQGQGEVTLGPEAVVVEDRSGSAVEVRLHLGPGRVVLQEGADVQEGLARGDGVAVGHRAGEARRDVEPL